MLRRNILVIGGAGYIGSHACKTLLQGGITPVVYDNLVYGHEDFVKWGPFERGDILDYDRLLEVMKQYRPEAVFHFAAFAYVGESVTNPEKYYRNNVFGSLNVVAAMRDAEINNLIFSSTCATYGVPQEIPMTESHPQFPINSYGRSKFFVEGILKDFATAHGLKSVALRYFNAAGADPEGEIGEDHNPETHLIPIALDVALGKRKEISIFGTDYDTPDGTCVRDYIHVADLADAHIRAYEYLQKGGGNAAFNLGNGNGFSVREVINSVERVTGNKIPVVEEKRRAGDPPTLIGSAEKAKKELGWSPKYSSLDTIVEHAWKWHQKRFA
jgi:UDP-glucose-4-epimerase GalE